MLVLSRRVGQEIVLPDYGVTIAVVRVNGNRVKLGITAPIQIAVRRKEIDLPAAPTDASAGSADCVPPHVFPSGAPTTLRTFRLRRSGP